MSDGDIILDDSWDVDADAGTRVEVLAVETSDNPIGLKYKFQYYNRERGETIFRYDNYHHDPEAGWHHYHDGDEPAQSVDFPGLTELYNQFRTEVANHDAQR